MLEINHLVKYYGNFKAVDDLCLSIPDGSIYGFVGPNGAGKTTTMKIICGLLGASSGAVLINEVDATKHSRTLREKIGYMPDFFGVYDNLSVEEYMDFYAGTYFIPYRDRKAIIGNLLELVGLEFKREAYVDTLSRGMKQRLCLARSLIHDPEVLILDEPASGLDPRARVEMKEILKQLKQFGKTIIISSHILTELAELCSCVGIFDKGRVIASGSINELTLELTNTKTIIIKPLLMEPGFVRALSEQPNVGKLAEFADRVEFGYSGGDDELARLVKALVMKDNLIVSISEKEGNLEEIFMQLTGGGEEHA